MLEEAVEAIKAGRTPNLELDLDKSIDINLRIPALIPDDYLPDVHTRLIMYKRISSSRSSEDLQELQVEMIDRFGLLPKPLKLLIRLTELKLRGQKYGIRKIDANVSNGRIEFSANTEVDPLSLVQLIQDDPMHFKLTGANQLQFSHQSDDADSKLVFINSVLDKFRINEIKAA
jgi:transcription-repair coupling factor (superfamily II helicase)